jgi:sugar lactone lactonase YvrE
VIRCFLRALASAAVVISTGAHAGERLDPAEARAGEDGALLWYDARLLGLEGQGWRDTDAPYDRLPARAREKVRPEVWDLSRHSAGLCVRFVTDSPAIHAAWTLTSARLAMPHMPASGVSGLDLYVRSEDGRWRWLATGRPTAESNTVPLASGLPPGQREYLLYLPLYNGVESLEIGVPRESVLERAAARPEDRRQPIVFYGTSITQGGCASRPGMVHTAILGRWFDRPVINLGFSGNGRMELELAELMAELDAAVYVIDCLPNVTAQDVARRTAPLVKALRQARPQTPILLVEDRTYADAFLISSRRERNESSRAALRDAFAELKAAGVDGLHYLEGDELLGADGEDTVDGSHPTDLGFQRQAEAFRKCLEPLLGTREAARAEPVFAAGARPELVLESGAGEGPAWHPEQGLFFSGRGGITRLDRDGGVHLFRENAGTNGLLFDTRGRLLACEPARRRVTRTEPDGSTTVLAERFEGRRFNTPNDLTIDRHGRIYFSDPRYGNRDGMEMVDSAGRPIEGVYRIDPDGTVARIITHEVDRPNGVLVSTDDRFLYVADNNNDTVGGARKLWRFRLQSDGTVDAGSRTLLFDWGTDRGPDGMVADQQGRLYVAAGLNRPNPPDETAGKHKGGIYVLSPDGELLEFVPIPRDEVTNCTFGGDDLRTLYVTAGGTLWSVRAETPGRLPWPPVRGEPP